MGARVWHETDALGADFAERLFKDPQWHFTVVQSRIADLRVHDLDRLISKFISEA